MCIELIDRLKVVYKDDLFPNGELKVKALKLLLEQVVTCYNSSIAVMEIMKEDGEDDVIRDRAKKTLANLSERRFNLINYIKRLD